MLEIRVRDNNKAFDITASAGINIERASSLFGTELPIATYSYPIDLPASANNMALLGFPDMPESTVELGAAIPVYLIIDGYTVIIGDLRILRANGKRYSVTITDRNPETETLQKSIKVIDYGAPFSIGSVATHALSLVGGNSDTETHVFPPHQNPIFDTTITVQAIVNSYDAVSVAYNADKPMVPFFYLIFVLEKIAEAMDLSLAGDWTTEAETKTLCIYNTWNIFTTSSTISVSNHLPETTVQQLLTDVRNMFNLNVYIDRSNATLVMQRKQMPNALNSQADWTQLAEPYWEVEPHKGKNEGYMLESGIDDADENSKLIANGELTPSSIKGIVSTASLLPVTANVGDIYYVKDQFQWGIAVTATPTWRILKHIGFAQKLRVELGTELITTNIGTLLMANTIAIGAAQLMPIALQTGNNLFNSSTVGETNPYSTRLLFYRGLQPTSNVLYTAPMASSDVWDYNGTLIGATGLYWAGKYGLYNTCYKDWLTMRSKAKSVTFSLRFTAAQLSMLDMNKPVIIDRNLYLIEKLNIQATARGIGRCTAKMLRV